MKALGPAILPVLISVIVDVIIGAGIAGTRPDYLHDSRLNDSPDAQHYLLIGRNVFLEGNYSRSDRPPYVPDMLRPPVYPLFAGILDVLGGGAAIYLAHSLLHVASCALVYLIAERHFGRRAAFFASLLFATDLMLAISNYEALSEPLFVFLLLASAYCLTGLPPFGASATGVRSRLILGALLLGLAILTRTVGLYLIPIYAGSFYLAGLRNRGPVSPLRGALLLACIAALPVGLWVARNYCVLSLPRLTTVDAVNLNYYVGAGAYQVQRGVSRAEAQEMISREHGLIPLLLAQNDFASGRPISEIDAELRAAWPEVVFKYPKSLAISSVLGLLKASVSHNAGQLAHIMGREWVAPGTGALLRLRPEAFRRLGQNGPWLSAAFAWQLTHVLLTLGLALAGMAMAIRSPRTRAIGLVFLAVVAYLYLTLVLYGFEAYYRCRIPSMPFLDLFGGYGLARIWLAGPGRAEGDSAP